jgi:DNA polymerase-3 subunit alpha
MEGDQEPIVHLHVHSENSLLDGLSKIDELITRAKEIGSPALALTDHGTCAGIPSFIRSCKKAGIKPIPGCEAYMTKNRLVKSEQLSDMRTNLCLKYHILNTSKKPDMKRLGKFLRGMLKNPSTFKEQADDLLKDYYMQNTVDLFSIFDAQPTKQQMQANFLHDINNYLDFETYHLLLIPIDNAGLADLYEIVSDAHINGFYGKPRTDLQIIQEKGLGKHMIATSTCLGGYFSHLCLAGRIEQAKKYIKKCKNIFYGYYLEKQASQLPKQIQLNAIIDQLAVETHTPKIVTCDVHFARKEDHDTQDALICMSINKCLNDPDRYHYAPDYYLKTAGEIRQQVNDDEAIANTLEIAKQVNVSEPKKPLFPKMQVAKGATAEALLRHQAWQNLFQMCLKHSEWNIESYSQRLAYELNVICKMQFADYFLIESDMINAANDAGYLTGPGRGSGAGSLTCYVMGITKVDPLKYGLLFERFLNPERAGYPDIDVDYSYSAARWTQNYLKKTYGNDRVAQIGTTGTMAARQVIRAVGKVLGYDLDTQDRFAKAIPDAPHTKLAGAYETEETVRAMASRYPKWWDLAKKLEGHAKSLGVHASGIVLSPVKIDRVVPLRRDKEGLETTQFDMEHIEDYLVKFDLLKLDTLDLIQNTLNNAGINGKININELDLEDPRVYKEIYQANNLAGIFQCESKLFQDIIRVIQPTNFNDLSVLVALGRPGPLDFVESYANRKHRKEEEQYSFPELKPVLKETYGILVYQEQVMAMSRILGGLTLGQSDMIRKGIGKKIPDLLNRWLDLMIYGSKKYKMQHQQLVKQFPKKDMIPLSEEGKPSFWVDYDYKNVPEVQGAVNRGFNLEKLLVLKEQWIKFGNYCFNKSHSVCYGMISFITAWLKCYYPVEFMAALLTQSENKKDKKKQPKNVVYIQECEKMGILVLPPNIKLSERKWTPIHKDGKSYILMGLSGIAGIKEETVEEIKSYDLSKVKTFEQFLWCINQYKTEHKKSRLNKTIVMTLIKSGALDCLSRNRNKMLKQYAEAQGREVPKLPANTSKKTIIQFERETIGMSLTYKSRWSQLPPDTQNIQFTGFIIEIKPFKAKRDQKEHCRLIIETQEDEINCLVFNRTWKQYEKQLVVGNKVTFVGNKSDDTFLVNQIKVHSPDETDFYQEA